MKCSALIRMLQQAGWFVVSQRGSHMKMRHADNDIVLIVPNHGSQEVGKGLELKILKDAGLR